MAGFLSSGSSFTPCISPSFSFNPVFSLAICRSVCALIRIPRFGVRSNRLFVLSARRCGTSTITAYSSQLEKEGMPSFWRKSVCWENSHSPWRRVCPTWRCCSKYYITDWPQMLRNIMLYVTQIVPKPCNLEIS